LRNTILKKYGILLKPICVHGKFFPSTSQHTLTPDKLNCLSGRKWVPSLSFFLHPNSSEGFKGYCKFLSCQRSDDDTFLSSTSCLLCEEAAAKLINSVTFLSCVDMPRCSLSLPRRNGRHLHLRSIRNASPESPPGVLSGHWKIV